MLPKVPANVCTENDPKKIVSYWTQCMRESLLRDPDLKNHQSVKIEQIIKGRLPPDVVARIQAALNTGKSEKTRSDPKPRPPAGQISAAGQPLPDPSVPVLVAPYLVASVRDRSRSIEEDLLALFWVPGRLRSDGSLQSDPDHLPFLSRELLDPPISDRKEVPPPIASWNEYDNTIRAMGVDWEEGWNNRIEHAKEMFRLVAGVGADEWEADGWQRARNSIVMPWNKASGPETSILPLCEAWLKDEILPGTLQTIWPSANHQPCEVDVASKDHSTHLGHYGDSALNRKQRDAVRAVRLLKEGQVQAVNGPPGTGKTSLLKTLIADAVVNAAAAGAEPPLILITSTNNQAVKKASLDLAVPDADGLPVERKRWLPGLRHFVAFEASLKQEKDSADFLLVNSLDAQLFSEDFERQAEHYFLDRFKEWSSRESPGVLPARVDLAFAKASLTEHLHKVIATIKAKSELIAKAETFVAQGDVPPSINDIRSRMNQTEMDASASKRKEDLSNRHSKATHTLDHRGKLQTLWIHWLLFLAGVAQKYLPQFGQLGQNASLPCREPDQPRS